MKQRIIVLIVAVYGVLFTNTMNAQSPNLDSAKAELRRINQVFDSSGFLGFDISIIYSTDTLFGKYEHQEIFGNYIINGKKFYSKLENNEYIQTDTFVYMISNDEKVLMMTKEPASNSGKFPIRDFADSVIKWYDTAYSISVLSLPDSVTRVVEFTGLYPNLPYSRFAVFYEKDTYHPLRIETVMQTPFDLPNVPDSLLSLVRTKLMSKRIFMEFTNYHAVTDLSVFDDANYAVYDRIRRFYRLTPKYRGYRLLANGVEGEAGTGATELSAPPSN